MSQKTSKKKRQKYSQEFKETAVARMQHCDSVVGLARELGICWSLLYRWKGQVQFSTGVVHGGREPQGQIQALQEEVTALKVALGTKTLEVEFFRSALQKVEARRQKAGGVASTTKSGK